MLINLIRFIFGKLIGDVTPEQKKILLAKFETLLTEVASAAAQGAVAGAMKK